MAKALPMTGTARTSREDRLAAKLRENLRRRKAQGRALGEAPSSDPDRPLPNGGVDG